jgi:hypothetical protein
VSAAPRSPGPIGHRPVLAGLRLLMGMASGLVVVAGIQLFVLTTRTDHFFAWTVAPPLSAAVDGAFYLAALTLLVSASRQREWAWTRPVAFGVLVISTFKLLATLLHTGRFHFHDTDRVAQVAAWGWLVVYAVVPPVLLVLLIRQMRVPGTDPPRTAPFPSWFRWVAACQSAVMLAVGALLFVVPDTVARAWPWALTPLTARSLGAWFMGVGTVGGLTVREDDFVRTRAVMVSSAALATLQFVALARFRGDVDWGAACASVYVAFFATLLGAGLYGWFAGRGPLVAGGSPNR